MTDVYRSFFKNFGRAYRTEHIRLQWANPALWIFGRDPGTRSVPCSATSGPTTFPGRGALPKEFIRLDPWGASTSSSSRAGPNAASSRSGASRWQLVLDGLREPGRIHLLDRHRALG